MRKSWTKKNVEKKKLKKSWKKLKKKVRKKVEKKSWKKVEKPARGTTEGIESETWIISEVEMNTNSIHSKR